MDEQWQYVGIHGQRIDEKDPERGDFWLWAAMDSDTKLVFSHRIGKRNRTTGDVFMADVAKRVRPGVQLATDAFTQYAYLIRGNFEQGEYTYGTEAKDFVDADNWKPSEAGRTRKNGIPKIAKATRKAVVGKPDLSTCTTAHVERMFLTVRQELTRFTRLTLAYSKDIAMHKAAVAMHFGIYNLVRKHTSLGGQTPAQAAGVEQKRWTLEDVVELTRGHAERTETALFLEAFAKAGLQSPE